MWREALRVRTDPRYSQMRDLIDAIRAGWWAYWDIRRERRATTAQTRLELRLSRQQQRLRAMTDDELLRCSIQWGGAVTYPELRRRGLPIPGGPTSV